MMIRLRSALIGGAAALAVAGAAAFLLGEFHRLSALRQHPGWVYAGIGLVRDAVIARAASDIDLPPGFAPRADPEGAALYQEACAQCHGAPGIAPADFALGMMPVPSNLAAAARERPPAEIFWLIRNGLKMSGMPPWAAQMTDAEMWQVTALVEAMPRLSPVEYRALLPPGALPERRDAVPTLDRPGDPLALADPERGRIAMQAYACRSCHLVEGIVGRSDLYVGPDLSEAGARRYIAGVLTNTPANMIRWIMAPQAVDPLSAMPDLGVTEAAARDMAAYIYALSGGPPETEEGAQEDVASGG